MRLIFIALLTANIMLFMWYQQQELTSLPRLQTIPERQAPSGEAGSIRLLSELGAEQRQQAASAAPRCFLLGGFAQQEKARQLEQRLLSLDIEVRVAVTDQEQGVDYWVYVPPLNSRQAALWQLRELQARNIDSYLITEGELENGILLGTFTSSDSAMSVADKVRLAGFEARLRELPRAYQEYWVEVAAPSQRLVDEALLARLAQDFSELKHQLISCAGVAYR
jgi:hypothetical protein